MPSRTDQWVHPLSPFQFVFSFLYGKHAVCMAKPPRTRGMEGEAPLCPGTPRLSVCPACCLCSERQLHSRQAHVWGKICPGFVQALLTFPVIKVMNTHCLGIMAQDLLVWIFLKRLSKIGCSLFPFGKISLFHFPGGQHSKRQDGEWIRLRILEICRRFLLLTLTCHCGQWLAN